MLTRLTGGLAILLLGAALANGQTPPPPPPKPGTAAYVESIYQTGRKTAMAATPTPDVLIVVGPKVTNSCTLLVTNNTLTITNKANKSTFTIAPGFSVYWSSNAAGPWSNAVTVASGNANWMETFRFTTAQRFFYTKFAANVTN